MPTTLPALLLFVALLLPGFIYVMLWERKAPHARPSAFRETALTVFVSVLAELVVLGLFIVLRAAAPAATPDVDRLVREGGKYALPHWVSLTWWGLGLLALATLLAAGAARWLASRPHPSTQSAWWHMLASRPEEMAATYGRRPDVRVCCFLDDGSQITGSAAWINQLGGDVTDRDLILIAPLFRWQEATGTVELAGHAVSVSARAIKAIQVRYELPPVSTTVVGATEAGGVVGGATIKESGAAGGAGSGQATGKG